jgi:ubiquinone/menaquinone biosynthesis C-methylase UbiE
MLSDAEKVTKNYYALNAGIWSAKHVNRRLWSKQYKTFQEFLPSGKIVDLGCGSGNDSFWFVGSNYDYLGVDSSEQMIEQARKANPKANFAIGDLYNLDTLAKKFDGFWAACSLLHIPKNKIPGVLQGVKRILKLAGIGFISIKEGLGEEIENSGDTLLKRFFAYYTLNEFAQILLKENFKILDQGKLPDPDKTGANFLYYFVQT